MGEAPDDRWVDRLSRQGEEALGRLAEELAGSAMVSGAVTRALEAREKAVQAQEAALGMLNLPSAGDIERVTRRLRSVSQRLEGIEDALDRLEERTSAALAASDGASEALDERLAGIGPRLDELALDVAALRTAVAPAVEPVPRAQERLTVTEASS